MQLLQITVTPMKCELQIENARLEYQQDFTPEASTRSTPAKLDIQTKPAELRLDSYELRHSLGFNNTADLVASGAQKGQQSLNQYVRGTVEEGAQLAKIEDGVTIGQLINQKMMQQPSTVTAFLPSGNLSVMWDPPQTDIQYEKGSSETDWEINPNVLSYVPGSVKLHITQYASVEVEYLGSPIYVPPSASPDYEEKTAG